MATLRILASVGSSEGVHSLCFLEARACRPSVVNDLCVGVGDRASFLRYPLPSGGIQMITYLLPNSKPVIVSLRKSFFRSDFGVTKPFQVRDGPNTTTTIVFQKSFASDATPKRHLMAHQMKNLCGFSVFHCVEGPFGASTRVTPKMKHGAPRDEPKNGRGWGWVVPYQDHAEECSGS